MIENNLIDISNHKIQIGVSGSTAIKENCVIEIKECEPEVVRVIVSLTDISLAFEFTYRSGDLTRKFA